ncbi:MAG: branched-chain amino acid transaminase [Caldilineaceae bacterium]|nr:branched-chain amino acid transaminase [Caldilineaceae bacterium]
MTRYAFFQDQIVPIEQAQVSIMTHTFNYGTGCFAGIRAYWNDDTGELNVFRLEDHYKRFLESANLLRAELPYTPADLSAVTLELLAREGWRQDAYIRPLHYKTDEIIGVRVHGLTDAVAIFSVPMGDYLARGGIHACVSSWRRVDDNAIPARGKIIGAYANSSLIKSDAVLSGFDEAIVLNQDGHVSEGSAANLMLIRDGALITPPITDNILEGIVRRSLMTLAREELGLTVVERSIDRSELYRADEAFFCGTGVQIAPIARIDHRDIGNGGIGPITQQLSDLFFRVVRGQEPKYSAWLTKAPALESIETNE